MRNLFENERYLEWIESFLCRTTICGRNEQRDNKFAPYAQQPTEVSWPPRVHSMTRTGSTANSRRGSNNSYSSRSRRQTSRKPSFADDENSLFLAPSDPTKDPFSTPPPAPMSTTSPATMIKSLYSSSPIGKTSSFQKIDGTSALSTPKTQQYDFTNDTKFGRQTSKTISKSSSGSTKNMAWNESAPNRAKTRDASSKARTSKQRKQKVASNEWNEVSPVDVAEIRVPTTATHMGSILQDQGQWSSGSRKAFHKNRKKGRDIDEKSEISFNTVSTISTERVVQQLKYGAKDRNSTADHMTAVSAATKSTMTREMLCIAPDGEESVHVEEEREILDGEDVVGTAGLFVRRMRDGELEECDFENGYSSAGSSNASF